MEEKPNAARIYDYYLGGNHNTAVDRAAAEATYKIAPVVRFSARANRAAVQRFTKYLVTNGLTQLIDLGSGLPTMGNVHEVAGKINPHCKVLYVDHDSTVVDYARRILEQSPVGDNVIAVEADLHNIEEIFEQAQGFINFDQPVGILCSSVLHFVTDEAMVSHILNFVYDNVAANSYLAITHGAADIDLSSGQEITRIYQMSTTPLKLRTRAEVQNLMGRFTLIPPGVVDAPQWQPDPDQPPIGGVYDVFGIWTAMGTKAK